MTDLSELFSALKLADAAGNTDDARKIADIIRRESAASSFKQTEKDAESAVAPTAPVEQPKERTFGEAATDLAAGLKSGIGSVIQLPGQLYGLATGDFEDSGILGFGKRIAKSGEDMKSEALKQKEKQRSQKIQDAEDKGQWEAFKTAFGETVKDPALFASFIAEQAPQMLVPFGGAKVIKGLTLAKGLRAGLPAIEATQAAGTAGTRAAIGAGAVQQGADIGAGAYEELYKALVLKGTPEEEAKSQALNLARAAGASGAVISLLAQRLPGAKTLEESFAGVPGTSGRLLGAAKGALGETASEIVEETGGKFAQNVAMRQVNPEQQLAQGLGATAGMAAIGGGTLGGVAGALRTPQADQATQPPPLPPEAPQIDPDKYSAVIKGLTAAIPDSGLTDSSKLGEIFKASGIENEAEVSAYLNQAITSGEIVANSNPVFNVTDANGKVLFNTVEKAVADKAAERLNTEDAGTATVEEALTTKFTKPTGMPQGIEVRAGQFKQDMFNISRGDTILNPEPLSAEEVGQKAYRLSKLTSSSTEATAKEVETLQKQIDTNNTSKEKLEAAGAAHTPEYAALSAQVKENNDLIQAKIDEVKQKGSAFSGGISITPAKASDEGFTLFKQGKPAEYFETEEALNQALAGNPTSVHQDTVTAAKEALREKLLPFMKSVGLENTGLRIMDSIENGQGESDGRYTEQLIDISLKAANPMGTLRHETIHALKELGAFSKQEWSLLESYAKKQWINQFLRQRKIGDSNYYDTYKKIYLETHPSIAGFDEYIIEEAIADAFKYFNATKPPANIIGNIYRKVKAFLEGMGNQLSGLGFQTADDVFKRVEAGGMKPTQQAGTGAAPRYSIFQRTPENIDEQNTAKPKALVKPKLIEGEDVVRDPIAQFLIINGSDIRNVPKHLESVVNVINQYNAFPVGANADETIRNMHETIVSNLTWLYRLLPANLRERAKLWYDGANRIANDVSKKYGYTVNQVAGVYASLSPQKDWFMNVSLGDRVISIMRERGGERINLAMKAWVDSYVKASKTKKDKVSRVEMQEKFRLIGDKTLNEMSDKEAAIFVRVFDETYNPRKYRIVTPEGGFLGFVTNNQNDEVDPEGDSDVPEGDVAWNGYGSIAKAVSIIRNGSKENISTQLGDMHKVRNFYNNILVPNSAAGHVTIDTHAVAAAFFKALSGASAEVMHNFGRAASKGLPSPGRSTLTGASGTYGFIADAYRDAAARIAKEDNIKLLPRELQSITWEAIRAIFPAAWKRENMSRVEDIYNRAKSGEITLAQAKSETEALATTKGKLVNQFAWESETSGDFVSNGGKSFDQDIHPDVAKRKARVMPPHTLKDTLRVNITAATDKIPGIDVLFKEANKGSLAATKVIQDAAQYNLEHLLSDIPEARISYDRGIGLYGEKREPTLGLNINFPSDSRNVVLAALNKFSNNFMQERFDVREATNEKIGSVFSDNSYATLAHRFTLNTALSTEEVQKIIKNSGLSGITFGINKNKENYIEAYYVAKNIEELNDESERNSYTRAIAGIREGLGKSAARVDEVVQRLWAYGRIGGARFGVTVDAGNLGSHVPASGSKDIKTAKVIAEYLYANNLEKVTEKERKQFPKSLKLVSQDKEISFKQHNLQRMIQKFFDLLPVENLNNRMVMKAYESLAKEVKRQYSVLPIKVEAKFERDNDGNIKLDKNNNPMPTAPYGETKNISMNMRKDIMDNNRLYIYPTMAESFGPKGYDFSKHPLLKQSGYTDSNGYPMTYNDLLRAVHDYYAHGPKSASFGALGEEAAWKNHMSMIKDPLARWALTMETRAQNSWVNFRDEVQHLSLPERGFSEQKASLLPVEFALTGDAAIDKPMHEFIKGLSSSQRLGSKPTNPNEFMKLMGEHNKNKVSGGYPSSLITKGKTPEKGRKFSLQDTVYIDGVNRPTTDSRGRPIFNTLEGIKNFWRWFDKSTAVDEYGRPRVMYHGTARDITAFKAKQAQAIFITDKPKFAENFADLSENWLFEHYDQMLTPEQIEAAKLDALSKIDSETKKDLRLTKNSYPSAFLETKEFKTALLEQMPTRGNIMPLYVKADKPYDYDNSDNVDQLVDKLMEMTFDDKFVFSVNSPNVVMIPYSRQALTKRFSQGDWGMTEHPDTRAALEQLGFDSFYMKENGTKNFAVMDNKQLKSAIGNTGEFNKNKEDIRHSIADNPQFERWFGDSKVVDKDGKPLVAYHGTTSSFNVFETKQVQLGKPRRKTNAGELGSWFAAPSTKYYTFEYDEGNAEYIAESFTAASTEVNDYKTGANVMPVYLSIKKPYDAGDYESLMGDRDEYGSWKALRKHLEGEGYDGIVIYGSDTDGNVIRDDWVAFNPTQIKSAIGNRGTYDEKNPDIRYSISSPDTPAFKRWFGDSKAVVKDGSPMVLYRGMDSDYGPTMRVSKDGALGAGIYMTPDPKFAQEYVGQNGNIAPLFASLQNPLVIQHKSNEDPMVVALVKLGMTEQKARSLVEKAYEEKGYVGKQVMSRALAQGFDGLMQYRDGNLSEVVAFSKTQVKSAIGNRGTFDPYNPDIRYSLRDDFITKFGQADLTNLNSKTHVREEVGFAKRLAAAISPDSRVKLRAQIINRLEAIERQTMKVSVDPRYGGSNELLADVSATAAALQSQRASGIAAESFKRGVPVYAKGFTSVSDLNGTVKGLIPIFQPLLNKYKDPMIWQLFQFYSATRRGGRFIQEGREKLFTAADIQKGKDYGIAYPEFDSVFKEYQKYNEGLVKFQIDTGVLTPELGRKWMMYSDYIPFYRQLNGEETLGPKLFQNFSGVKPTPILKGSDVKIADFLETIILNSRSAIENGMKNVASQRIARDAMRTNSPGMNDMARKLMPYEKDAADVIHVRENGVDVRYKVADILLVEAMKGLGTTEMGSMLKFLSYPTKVLRDLVTKDPGFMLANLFRDSAQAYVTSGVNMIPIIDTFKQAAKILANQSPEAKALMAAGIGGGYEFSGDVKASAKAVSAALNDKAGIKTGWQKALWPVSKVWSALEAGTTASDLATRSEIYARVMKSTNGNEAEAVYQALEVMNFGRMGSSPIIQVASALVPFFNARVQGLDVLYRAGTGRLASASAKTQQKLFARRAMYIMGMSIAYWMLARDTDEWKRASKETRDNYWIVGNVKIPIPFEIGTVFKVLPERILEYTFGNDTGADLADSAFRNIASTLKMNPIPQAMLPLVEAYWIDYSFFTGNGVVGRGMEKLDPQFQLREGTSLVAKKMGDITGMSPVKIDHVLQGYTGAMGMYAASAISAMIRTEDDGAKASMSLEQTPILKRFFASDKAGGSIDAFYEFKKQVDMVVATQDELQKRGNPEQYIEYMKTNGKLLGAKQIVSNIGDKLSEMRKLRNIVNFSKSMPPDQKRETLDNIRMAEIKLTESIKGIRAMVTQ